MVIFIPIISWTFSYISAVFSYFEFSVVAKDSTKAWTDEVLRFLFQNDCKLQIAFTDIIIDLDNYENPIKKNIKFSTIKDNENYDTESKISNSNTISTNNTYKKTIFDSKKIIINRKNGDNSDRRIKVKQALKEISSSSSKSLGSGWFDFQFCSIIPKP